jgi:transcription antitermination factor NusG
MACRTVFPIPFAAAFDLPWFAVRVKSNRETVVSTSLRNAGYEEFFPRYVCRRRYRCGFKDIERPLFPGYLFARLNPARRLSVLMIPGVIEIVGSRKTPIAVEEHEIAALRQMVGSGLNLQLWPFLKVGDRVLIETGSLTGIEGILLRLKNQYRLIASITLLQRSIAVEIERNWVRPLTHSGAPRPVRTGRLAYSSVSPLQPA